jgi:SAM-dependent methyltransferase
MLERVVPGVTALKGSAERLPLEDASVDGAFAAQAFHWFDKPVAVPEIVRVLRPGGVFAIVWNDGDDDLPDPRPPEFVREIHAIRDEADKQWKHEPRWEDLLRASGLFAEVHERVFVAHEQVLDRGGILDNLRSTSWIASRENGEEIIERLATLVPDATYAIPNRAYVIWAARA